MDFSAKVVTVDKLVSGLEEVRQADKKIVFTNGCFDILHVGHVRYLAAARSEGDLLVVGLNSDTSVRSIKGEGRPLVSQDHQHPECKGGYVFEEIQHLDVGHHVIRTVDKIIQCEGVHFDDDGPHEKCQHQVLQAAQRVIQPGGDPGIFAENEAMDAV